MTDQLQNAPAVPANDPGTYRRLPERTRPVDPEVVERLLAAEWARFTSWSGESGAHNERASKTLPLGVTVVVPALGALPDLDRLGARRLAHRRRRQPAARPVDGVRRDARRAPQPARRRAVTEALTETGTLFVTPSPQATEMSERFCDRFQLDMIRFTNSGTESLMYAIRCARAYTERKAIVKIEGGYHGGYDALQVSVKPGLDDIGPADAPIPQVPVRRRGRHRVRGRLQRPRQLERVLAEHGNEIAALVIEPVIENLSIVVPDEGYLAGVRAACDEHGVVLIFDEVKTGLTAGYAGAAQRLGVTPDLDHAGQVHRRRPAAGGVRRQARGHGGRRRRPDGALRHLQRQPAGDGGGPRGRRDLHPRGTRRGRGAQRARAGRDRRDHRRVRAAGPHRRVRA